MKISTQVGNGSVVSGRDAQQNGMTAAPSGTVTSRGTMPSPSVYLVHNGEVSATPRVSTSIPDTSQPPGLDTLEGCKLQVAQLARDETQLEAELKDCELSLAESQKLKIALEQKITHLDQPLNIEVEAVELSDEDIRYLTLLAPDEMVDAAAEPEGVAAACTEPGSVPAVMEGTAELISKDSIYRLNNNKDVAELNPLQSQHPDPIMFTSADLASPPRHFGDVPVLAPLPEDSSVAAILACNRYRSTVSHVNSLQRLPAHVQQAAFRAQHYTSGRQWVMMIKPQAGAAWSLPGVQETIDRHREQVSELSAALQATQDEQNASADNRARQLAVQLTSMQPQSQDFSEHPASSAVREHLHNFRCMMPAQLNQREQWRRMLVDGGSLVEDPVALLQEKSFTSPWTKREREFMDNMLGEQGKKFANVAKQVGTRSIAECIDRYYKVHLRDEFKPTWRKMARIKRAADGKNKREEHSKVLAPVSRVPARQRHSAWTGGATQAGLSGSVHWPPMSASRLTAATSGNVGDFGMSLAALGALPEARSQGRLQDRRRGATNASDSMHGAIPMHLPLPNEGLQRATPATAPFISDRVTDSCSELHMAVLATGIQSASVPRGVQVAASVHLNTPGNHVDSSTHHDTTTADVETVPMLQIATLSTQAGSEADVNAISQRRPCLSFCARDAAANVASGVGYSPSGSMLLASQAPLQHVGRQLPQGSVQMSFPALDREIAAEGPRTVASLHLAYGGQRAGFQGKGPLGHVGIERHPSAQGAVNGEPYSRGVQMSRGDGLEQHQS